MRCVAGTIVHVEAQVHLHKGRQGFCTEDVCNVFTSCSIGFGSKNHGFLAFCHDIADSKFDRCADACISLQHSKNLSILSFNVLLEFASPDRQIGEKAFDCCGGTFLTSNDRGSSQLPRCLKIEPGSLWGFVGPSSANVERGEGTER